MIKETRELDQKIKEQEKSLDERISKAIEQFEKNLNPKKQDKMISLSDILEINMLDDYSVAEKLVKAGCVEDLYTIDDYVHVLVKPPHTDIHLYPIWGNWVEIEQEIVCSIETAEFIKKILKEHNETTNKSDE